MSHLKINWNDFTKVDIRCGKIVNVEDFPEALNPSYKLKIDFGENLGIKKSSAQITDLYEKDDLLDTLILAVVNFPPKQIGPTISEVLVLGVVQSNNQVVLVRPDKGAELGARLA
ncbi:MAG: tRNA-binding protein [Candidatus Heimdallarchaeota archaeon]|nr:tRNA-binding protein [Candidatus Heimdallarchaeota archaeon]